MEAAEASAGGAGEHGEALGAPDDNEQGVGEDESGDAVDAGVGEEDGAGEEGALQEEAKEPLFAGETSTALTTGLLACVLPTIDKLAQHLRELRCVGCVGSSAREGEKG